VRNVDYPMLFLITAQQHETRDKMQYAYCYITVMASSRRAPELRYIQAWYYTRLYRIYWKGVLLRHHKSARMAYLNSLINSVYDSYEIHQLSTVKNYRYTITRHFWFRANICWFIFLSFFSFFFGVIFKIRTKITQNYLYLI
jgi:hypothetical protein